MNQPLEIQPVAGSLGAEIAGVDLAEPLPGETFETVHRAFLDHGVVFFRDQKWTRAQQLAFARRFCAPEVHPIVYGTEEHPEVIRVHKPAGESASFGVGWHSDNSFFDEPSLGSVLYGEIIPPYGGDTLFTSTERAYEGLSPAMKQRLEGLVAVHSAARAYHPDVTGEGKYRGETPISYKMSEEVEREARHPVVRTHPETGRKSLYVNPMFTDRIEGLGPRESQALLDLLFDECARPEYTCRFRWRPGSVAVWDNRCVQHYALDDYRDFERLMFRVTIAGDRPV